MKMGLFKQRWLNLILHFSSLIYKLKHQLVFAGVLRTLVISLTIVVLEILLSIVSLPFYFFVRLDEDNMQFGGDTKVYRLRRKLTLGILIAFILFQVLGTALASMGFGFLYNYLIYS